jgi:flagellar assembly protein FliH
LFKINQSVVDQMNPDKSFVVIRHKDFVLPQPKADTDTDGQKNENRDYIRDVRAEADRIIEETRSETEEIRRSAWQKGYDEGKNEAKREVADFLSEQANEARSIFKSLEKYKQELFTDLKENVLTLSFDIAEKIVNIALEKDDKLYIGIVEKAIQSFKEAEKFVLRVSRKEYDKFFKEGTQWLRDETGCVPFEVVCDPQMGEGGCILESDDRILNAGVQLQLSKIRHLLQEKKKTDD